MRLINLRNQDVIAERVEMADTFLSRLRGLLGRKKLPENHAMVLNPCSSIHTFFMSFCIDAVFLDSQGEVVHLITKMSPCSISPVIKSSKMVIELPGGTVEKRILPGDRLKMER